MAQAQNDTLRGQVYVVREDPISDLLIPHSANQLLYFDSLTGVSLEQLEEAALAARDPVAIGDLDISTDLEIKQIVTRANRGGDAWVNVQWGRETDVPFSFPQTPPNATSNRITRTVKRYWKAGTSNLTVTTGSSGGEPVTHSVPVWEEVSFEDIATGTDATFLPDGRMMERFKEVPALIMAQRERSASFGEASVNQAGHGIERWGQFNNNVWYGFDPYTVRYLGSEVRSYGFTTPGDTSRQEAYHFYEIRNVADWLEHEVGTDQAIRVFSPADEYGAFNMTQLVDLA